MLCPFPLYQNFAVKQNFSADKSPARQQAGGAEIPSENKENSIFSNELEFVSDATSARGRNRTFYFFIISEAFYQ